MRPVEAACIALCTGLLSACAAPDYQPAASAQIARIHLGDVEWPHICVTGQSFTLQPDSRGDVLVTAGAPVQLTVKFTQGAGKCYPSVRFTPQPGKIYDVVYTARAEHCIATVMLHDASAQYGIRLDTTARPVPERCQ